jgi:hypothetical protein
LELQSSQVPHHLSALLLSSSANTVLISETKKKCKNTEDNFIIAQEPAYLVHFQGE